GTQLLPLIDRMRDVLDAVAAPVGVFGLEVERTEIDRVVGRAIDAMECHADEALSLNVLALQIDLNGAVGELNPLHVRDAVTLAVIQTNALPRSIGDDGCAAVEESQTGTAGELPQIGLDRFSLAEHPRRSGESNGTGKRRDDKLTSIHNRSFPSRHARCRLTKTGPRARRCGSRATPEQHMRRRRPTQADRSLRQSRPDP